MSGQPCHQPKKPISAVDKDDGVPEDPKKDGFWPNFENIERESAPPREGCNSKWGASSMPRGIGQPKGILNKGIFPLIGELTAKRKSEVKPQIHPSYMHRFIKGHEGFGEDPSYPNDEMHSLDSKSKNAACGHARRARRKKSEITETRYDVAGEDNKEDSDATE